MDSLNLFYEEPDPDRWVSFDRYPRGVVRRLLRGKRRPGGQKRVFLNLSAGLELLRVPYRVNDYRHAQSHPDEIACIVGKPHVLNKRRWKNPILFGTAVFSHPVENPAFFEQYPTVKRILVPGEWMRQMWEPYFRENVISWPVGIDTERWKPTSNRKEFDFLLYDKVRWNHDEAESLLIEPILQQLRKCGLSCTALRYGSYREEHYHTLLDRSRAMIFLCEHETQGIAYQQALSTGVPILAWDNGGYWQDPAFYPHKVQFKPVSSVPYWDDRCGIKFNGANEFTATLDKFLTMKDVNAFAPRDFILENLNLEKCAERYVEIWKEVNREL